MTALTFSLLFFGALCVGVCLGFFLAAIFSLNKPDYEAAFHRLEEDNEKLVKENSALISKLWEIEGTIKKYFGE